jgi:biopolymer transport protein ExbD
MDYLSHSLKKTPDFWPALIGLVNLFFILLIIFMINSNVIFWAGTPVETSLSLPGIRSEKLNIADKMIITIARPNEFFFNDKRLDWDRLQSELSQSVSKSREGMSNIADLSSSSSQSLELRPKVVLRADKNVSYETISQVLDLARSLNLDVFLAADPKPERTEQGNFIPDGVH